MEMDTETESSNSFLSISAGGCRLAFDRLTGVLCGLRMEGANPFVWTDCPVRVSVRDDLLRRELDNRDVTEITFRRTRGGLEICKTFSGVPWRVVESFGFTPDAISWDARVEMPAGEFRSCAISFGIPWPKANLCKYKMKIWTAKAGMPMDLSRMPEMFLEHGEITSGIAMPAIAAYHPKEDVGLLLAVPFNFRTPRAGFKLGLQSSNLETIFDWLALSPTQTPRASLVIRAIGGDWRPAFGWLVERYREFFEPRSTSISNFLGGMVCGNYTLPKDEAAVCSKLGLSWYEIHRHFYAYGNYHPVDIGEWPSGETKVSDEFVKLGNVTVETIRQTIRTLHDVHAAAMMYIQVGGDGDPNRLPADVIAEKIVDQTGQSISAWPGTILLNADVGNAFGKEISRQIDGMVERYPEMDGVFLDQACYNFLDFAHDDGISAIDNRPCYRTGFNYQPHLEHLSRRLHPDKSIIANGPHAVGIMKYADGFIVECLAWLVDQLQYYAVFKPVFFLIRREGITRETIEQMFQHCLIYAAGFTSYAHAAPFRDLYDLYLPLIRRLYGRQWIFDPDPLTLPAGFSGNIYRGRNGNLLASVVNTMSRVRRNPKGVARIRVRTTDVGNATRVQLHSLGEPSVTLSHTWNDDSLEVDIPMETIAAVVEIHTHEN